MTVTIRVTPERVGGAGTGPSGRNGRPGESGGGFRDLLDAIATDRRTGRASEARRPVSPAEEPARSPTVAPTARAAAPASRPDEPVGALRHERASDGGAVAEDRGFPLAGMPPADEQPVDRESTPSAAMPASPGETEDTAASEGDALCQVAGEETELDGGSGSWGGGAQTLPAPLETGDGDGRLASRARTGARRGADTAPASAFAPGSLDAPPVRLPADATSSVVAAPSAGGGLQRAPHSDTDASRLRIAAEPGTPDDIGPGGASDDLVADGDAGGEWPGTRLQAPVSSQAAPSSGEPRPAVEAAAESIGERLARSGLRSRRLDERARVEARTVLSHALGTTGAPQAIPGDAVAPPPAGTTGAWRLATPVAYTRSTEAGSWWAPASGLSPDEEAAVDANGAGSGQDMQAGLEETAEEIADAVLSSAVRSARVGNPSGVRPEDSHTGTSHRDATASGPVVADPTGTWSPAAGGRTGAVTAAPGTLFGGAADETPAAVREQVVRAVVLAWRNGVGEAKLRLTPEHLGDVVVRLRIEQGAVQAVVQAQTVEARERIQAHESELRAALAEQGLNLARLAVTLDPDDRRGRSAPRHRQPLRTSKRVPDDQVPRFVVSV